MTETFGEALLPHGLTFNAAVLVAKRVKCVLRRIALLILRVAPTAPGIACSILPLAVYAEQQGRPTNTDEDIEGVWQGSLHAPVRDLRISVLIRRGGDKHLQGVLRSLDEGGDPISVTTIAFQAGTINLIIQPIGATYNGEISGDRKSIAGMWTQGQSQIPLRLTRVNAEDMWTVPGSAQKLEPMAADVDPSFEVATIKPSKGDQVGNAVLLRGRHIRAINTTLIDLIKFGYDVHGKQIAGGPKWMESLKFDIDGVPDADGVPSATQIKSMIRKLLSDRFELRLANETRELPAFTLRVAKKGPKLTARENSSTGLPSLFFPQLGVLSARNASMKDFAALMQSVVLERPVIDQTELQGRWDFMLRWTPDDSQFGGLAMAAPTDDSSAPAPPLYTAIEEQLGLKLDSGRAQVPVLVVEYASLPTPN